MGIRHGVVWEADDDGRVFLCQAHSPEILSLDEVGSYIWLNMETTSLEELASVFDDPVEAQAGIKAFIATMTARGFLD